MNPFRSGPLIALIVVSLFFVIVGLGLRAMYAPEWQHLDPTNKTAAFRPWAVEADCYSQLARDQRILNGQGLIQNHIAVENWPEGLIPSTTATFDYAILLLYFPLKLLTPYPLDWAGALVSPLLWLGLVLFWLLFRSREFTLLGRALFVIGSAMLPVLVWGTAFGRPRHQSLILALMAVALTAEYERWNVSLIPKRAWNIFAGVIWGLACWTSLFEPVLVITLLVIFNLVVRRKESPAFLISYGCTMLLALALEGYHVFNISSLSDEMYACLLRWLGTIAEVRGIGLETFIGQMTMLSFVAVVPFISWGLLRRKGDRRVDTLLVILTGVLFLFAIFQLRWMKYANLAELFLIVRFCQVDPLRWSRLLVMGFFSLALIYDNGLQIQARAYAPPNQPSPELAKLAKSIDAPGGIMAPWWISPGLLYFSGQPIVGGSSHCGISGIVDSARFYTATSWVDAERILQQRKVRWIVVMDDKEFVYPVLNAERNILGLPLYTEEAKGDAEQTVWQILVNNRFVPTFLRLRAVTPGLRLYEFQSYSDK